MLKKIKNKNIVTMLSVMLFTTIYAFLFLGHHIMIPLDRYSTFLLLELTIFASLKLPSFWQNDLMKKYRSKLNIFFLILIILISGFMMVGQSLFLTSSYIDISFKKLLFYLGTCVWLFPILYAGIYGLERFTLYIQEKQKQKVSKKGNMFLKIFLIGIVFWGIYLISTYPGTITSDTIDQWLQASGIRTINSAHPPLLTIILRLFAKIGLPPFAYLIVQICCFSAMIAVFFNLFYKNGLPKLLTYIFATLFIVAPSNYLNVVTLWKDIPYTLCSLWMGYLLLKFILEKDTFFHDWKNILLFTVATVMTALFRHNGIGPLLFTILFFIGYFFYSKKKIFLVLSGIIVVSYWAVSGPVYQAFQVKAGIGTKYSTYVNLVMRPTGLLYHNNGTLSKKSTQIMARYASYEQFHDNYDPFNSDTYGFNQEIKAYQGDKKGISTGEVAEVLLELMTKYPGVVIKERLDGSDLMWNLSAPNNGFNQRYAFGIWPPKNLSEKDIEAIQKFLPEIEQGKEAYLPSNIVAKAYIRVADMSSGIYILDNLFFRSGIWLIFFFLGLLFMMNHCKKLWIMNLPMLGTTATWIVLFSFQTYRYVWYIPVSVFFFLISIVVFSKKQEKVLGNHKS